MDFVCKLYGNTYAVHVTAALVGVATLNLAPPPPPCCDVANSKRPLLIIPKVQLRLRVTRRSTTALARYPLKLAKIVCG